MFIQSVRSIVAVAAVVLHSSLPVPCIASSNQSWWDGFAPPPDGAGMNNHVYDLAVYNGELVAGGAFTQAGANTCGRHIARFNGIRWKRFGCGTDGVVSALLPIGSDLYVGGAFGLAGGAVVKNVARWDGTSWHAVGTELNGQVMALAQYGGELVAGGSFDVSDGSPANGVARWDGASWQPLGQGVSGWVLALQEFDGDLYAGGWFTEAGGNPATHLARWDGSSWSDFGTTLTDGGTLGLPVEVLTTEYNGNLIVGGDFSHINGLYVHGLAEWNGSTWSPLGVGLTTGPSISDVTVYRGDLVVHGYFMGPGGSNHVARRIDGVWLGLGSGVQTWDPFWVPSATVVFDDGLYFGGNIMLAGEIPSAYVARWSDGGATDVPEDRERSRMALRAHPNPFRGETVIQYETMCPVDVNLAVYDASGRLVRVLRRDTAMSGYYAYRWSGEDQSGSPVAAGVYFVRLAVHDGVVSHRIVLIR